MTLSETDAAILTFERLFWRSPSAKEQAVRDRFGMTGTVYTQRLVQLLDEPDAAVAFPDVVSRLRRVRDERRRQRDARAA